MEETGYIIGIDWGNRRCGIALADTETLIATGHGESKKQDLITNVKKIAEEVIIREIIIGFSFLSENDRQNAKIQEIVSELEVSGFTVKMEEEMFSTKMAQNHLVEAQKKHISKNDNVESARIILQSWIDKHK